MRTSLPGRQVTFPERSHGGSPTESQQPQGGWVPGLGGEAALQAACLGGSVRPSLGWAGWWEGSGAHAGDSFLLARQLRLFFPSATAEFPFELDQ